MLSGLGPKGLQGLRVEPIYCVTSGPRVTGRGLRMCCGSLLALAAQEPKNNMARCRWQMAVYKPGPLSGASLGAHRSMYDLEPPNPPPPPPPPQVLKPERLDPLPPYLWNKMKPQTVCLTFLGILGCAITTLGIVEFPRQTPKASETNSPIETPTTHDQGRRL